MIVCLNNRSSKLNRQLPLRLGKSSPKGVVTSSRYQRKNSKNQAQQFQFSNNKLDESFHSQTKEIDSMKIDRIKSKNIKRKLAPIASTQKIQNEEEVKQTKEETKEQPGQFFELEFNELAAKIFRHSPITLISFLGKKEIYFEKIYKSENKLLNYQLLPDMKLTKEQVTILQDTLLKLKKNLSNRARQKYRQKFNIMNQQQLVQIKYNLKKRMAKLSQQQKNTKQQDFEQDDTPITPPQKKKKQQVQCPDFTTWKRKNNVENDEKYVKVFIIKGGYQDLREALLQKGWVENTDVYSPFFDLKWTCKLNDIDYNNLFDYQVVNHFDQNQCLTSKYGLCRNIRSLTWIEKCDIYQFYPRCYDLGDQSDFQDFIEDFKFSKAESILIDFHKQPNKTYSLVERCRIRLSLLLIQRRYQELLPLFKNIIFNDQIPLIDPAEWTVLIKDKQREEIEKMLIQNNFPDAEENFYEKYFELVNKFIEGRKNDQQFTLNSQKNIWILKPEFSSRGRGIRCFDDLYLILDHVIGKVGSFVVQKYIEKPLIIKNRKFDIRQWVLVQDIYPLKIWFFNECYIRFSAEEYMLDNIQNRYAHLTNNSIAKYSTQFYQSEIKGNMWSQEQFQKYLQTQAGYDIFGEKIQPKFREIIIYTLKCVVDQIKPRKRSFELFGYDFLIDENFTTWLIEINSSPAMDHSTWLTGQLVPKVLENCVKIMTEPNQMKNKKKVGGFTLIYNSEDEKK